MRSGRSSAAAGRVSRIVTTCAASKPVDTADSWRKVRSSAAAPSSSTIDSATCPTTARVRPCAVVATHEASSAVARGRWPRHCARARGAEAIAGDQRRVERDCQRDQQHAAVETHVVCERQGRLDSGRSAPLVIAGAIAIPAAPAMAKSPSDSAISCRTSRPRVAPSEVRTANSRLALAGLRQEEIGDVRAGNRQYRGDRQRHEDDHRPDRADHRLLQRIDDWRSRPCWSRDRSAASRCAIVESSVLASATATPGFSRAMAPSAIEPRWLRNESGGIRQRRPEIARRRRESDRRRPARHRRSSRVRHRGRCCVRRRAGSAAERLPPESLAEHDDRRRALVEVAHRRSRGPESGWMPEDSGEAGVRQQ